MDLTTNGPQDAAEGSLDVLGGSTGETSAVGEASAVESVAAPESAESNFAEANSAERNFLEPGFLASDSSEPHSPDSSSEPAGRKRAPKSELRIHDEPAFVLHGYPYKETSLIVEVLTRHYGRIALVARGAKRPRSALRGVLQAFQPLALAWTGGRGKSSELRTLAKAEWVGGVAPLRGEGLLCGFYLNELLLKLLARDDAHEALFDAYVRAIAGLAQGGPAAPTLRAFEVALLREAGYAMRVSHCVDSGEPISADGWYRYRPEHGPFAVAIGPAGSPGWRDEQVFSGQTLLDIGAGDFSDAATLVQSKQLMRQLLNYHLAGQSLNTRQIMVDLQNL